MTLYCCKLNYASLGDVIIFLETKSHAKARAWEKSLRNPNPTPANPFVQYIASKVYTKKTLPKHAIRHPYNFVRDK